MYKVSITVATEKGAELLKESLAEFIYGNIEVEKIDEPIKQS